MKPRRTHLSNSVFALAGGTEDNDLWTQVDAAAQTVSSVWVPTDEERRAIAAGQNIELTIYGGQPPVSMRIVDTPLGKPPAPVE